MIKPTTFPSKPSNGYLRNFKKLVGKNHILQYNEMLLVTELFDSPLLQDINPKRWAWLIEYYSITMGVRTYWYHHPQGYNTFKITGDKSMVNRFKAIIKWHLLSSDLYFQYYYDKVKTSKKAGRKRLRNNPNKQPLYYKNDNPTQYASMKLDTCLKDIKVYLTDLLHYQYIPPTILIDSSLTSNIFRLPENNLINSDKPLSLFYSPKHKYKFKTIVNGNLRKTILGFKSSKGTYKDL